MRLFLYILSLSLFLSTAWSAVPVTGELMRWHKLTLDFAGPQTSEAAATNPFANYRLDVTFTHAASGKSYFVPGYYAADGNAANTSATSGNIWRVHFAPDETGTWNYSASFRSGSNIATSTAAGSSAGFFDGDTGSFNVAETNKTGRDFRGKGRLDYVGKHHLRFAGTGEYFMKAGVDAPENFLAYADFDGDFKTDGNEDDLVKTWGPHVADWQSGDPVWQGSKGKGMIGAINYLASEGLNAFSFLTMNINGDDKNVFPYTTYGERSRLDVSRMDQWEIVFEHGTRNGMHLNFKTQETENQNLLDGGNLGPQRILYYRELIARFGHNLGLNWNLGEECTATLERKQAWAQYFHDADPYHHPIVIHNGSTHYNMMGSASQLTGFSLQLNASDFTDMFSMTKDYIDRSVAAGKPWVVACDEPGDAQYSLRPDDNASTSQVNARKHALWGNIMAGGAGVEWYFGYALHDSDLTCEDYRSRAAFWPFCDYALQFLENNAVPFELMKNQNSLVSGNGNNANRCLAKTGDAYLVHLPSGGSATLNLSGASGSFSVKWFNPRTGSTVNRSNVNGGGTVSLGSPPDTTTSDWVVLVRSGSGGASNTAPVVSAGSDKSAVLSSTSVGVNLSGSATDDGLPQGSAVAVTWSRISGPASVAFSSTSTLSTTATFSATGTYVLRLTASDGDLTSSDDVTVTITSAGTGNTVPVANAGPDSSAILSGASATVNLNGTATDDGLPAGSSLGFTWSTVSGPAAVAISSPGTSSTSATFSAAGTYVLRLSVSDSALVGTDDVTVTINASGTGGGQSFVATHDAYLQNGSNYNNSDLRAESTSRSRVIYLQFDLSTLSSAASSARLRLTESNDPSGGSITLRVFAALSNNWTETGITGSNAPAKGAEVALFTGDIADGASIEFDLSSRITGPGIYSFIVQADSTYRDVSLASAENTALADRPVLVVASGSTATNQSPTVSAGTDRTATLSNGSAAINLTGSATDDGLPTGSNLETEWSVISGPAAVAFDDPQSPGTTVTFTAAGSYTLRLSGTDGDRSASDDLVVGVSAATSNSAPQVNAGADRLATLSGGSATVALAGSASDDGLPTGSSLSVTWSQTSGPAAAVFANPNAASTNVTFNTPGDYVLRLTASDSALTSSDEVAITVSAPTGGSLTSFGAVHDAYLQNGTNYNNADLRAETTSRTRVAYLQFDLSSLGSSPTTARLRLTEGADPSGGSLTVRVFAAQSNNWTESAINGTNAPAKGAELASFTGDITDGRMVEFDVGAFVTGRGIYSFIVQVDATYRDIAFASAENSVVAARPVLVLTLPQASAMAALAAEVVEPPGETVIDLGLKVMAQGGAMQVRFNALPDTRYTIERSTNLTDWEPIQVYSPEVADSIEFVDPAPPAGAGFYRVTSEP